MHILIPKTVRISLQLRIILWMMLVFAATGGAALLHAESQTVKPPEKAFKLKTDEMIRYATGEVQTFPKYTTQLINIANRNAQSTRARYVGQMSELINDFDGDSYDQWVRWYLDRRPDAIDTATDRTYKMIEKMRRAMADIDRKMVRRWIEELVLTKTYVGLRFQKSILKKMAEEKDLPYRPADPSEESKGIDGYIGTDAVSIKPVTFLDQPLLQDEIPAEVIFYEKVRGGINVYYNRQK
ncbi:MAG: MjaI family restriction endonuclease [Thermodesulfobacteriota bacterium]